MISHLWLATNIHTNSFYFIWPSLQSWELFKKNNVYSWICTIHSFLMHVKSNQENVGQSRFINFILISANISSETDRLLSFASFLFVDWFGYIHKQNDLHVNQRRFTSCETISRQFLRMDLIGYCMNTMARFARQELLCIYRNTRWFAKVYCESIQLIHRAT